MKMEFLASFAERVNAVKIGIDLPNSGPDNVENEK